MRNRTFNINKYFILSLFFLLIIGGLGLYTNKIEKNKKEQNFEKYRGIHFSGNERGVVLRVDSKTISLGMRGVPLEKHFSINDSISKQEGDAKIYLFKRDKEKRIVDTVIIWN